MLIERRAIRVPFLTAAFLTAVLMLASISLAEADTEHTAELTDPEIRSAIVADIEESERFSGALPSVETAVGIVRLSGIVESLQEKQLAASIAKRTRGVQAVQNQILVKRSDRKDSAIEEDVEKVLRLNDSVAEPRITADVNAGRVSLFGKVESLAEKRIAEFSTSGVRGVTGIDNRITVEVSSERSDAELRDEIKALIVQSVYFDDATIEVDVEDNVAHLSGEVVSVAAKDRLLSTAEIWGVSSVDVSNVSVNEDAADPTERKRRFADVSDTSIKEAILRSFQVDPLVFSRVDQIDINVNGGRVTLDGTTDRLRIKNRAADLARNVIGVRQVFNKLEVEYSDSQPSDMEIIGQTQLAFASSAYLDRADFRVHCQRAHVTLYGVVDSELEKEVAEYVASGVEGVVHVNNSLVVNPEPSGKSDAEIKQSLERKLDYALLDDSSNVEVTIEDGVAILQGEVDTWRQWQTVMELAIEAGAHHPHNLIDVRYHPPHGAQQHYIPE